MKPKKQWFIYLEEMPDALVCRTNADSRKDCIKRFLREWTPTGELWAWKYAVESGYRCRRFTLTPDPPKKGKKK